jgi:selenoprotein W-related protein
MPNAAGLAARIIGGWSPVLVALELVPGTGGVFDVDVDGERIFFKKMIGRYPEPDDVLPLLREVMGPELM